MSLPPDTGDSQTPEPQKSEEGGSKGPEQTPKPKPEAKVTTLGYRLETVGNVDLSPRQLLEWEGAFRAADVLKMRLEKTGIDSRDKTNAAQPLSIETYQRELEPVLLDLAAMFDRDNPLSDEQLKAKVAELQGMMDIHSLIAQEAVRVVTISEQPEPENETDDSEESSQSVEKGIGPMRMNELFYTWIHDTKGKATAPKLTLQMLARKRDAIIKAGGDPIEELQARVHSAEEMVGQNMLRLDEILESGMPFSHYIPEDRTTEEPQGETLESFRGEPQRVFPHIPVGIDLITDMVRNAIKGSGQKINLHPDKILDALGSQLTADWNPQWAERMIENLISNAQKAHLDADVDPSEQFVDVFIGVVDGSLKLLIGDRGKGYPENMIDAWADPIQRAKLPTGWTKEDIPTTGLGLREHTAILEQQFHGEVVLYNWTADGGAATLLTIPLTNPPSVEEIKRIEEPRP